MDNEIVLPDTQTQDEELDLDLELDEGESKPQESKPEITDRERRLYARLKKAEADLKAVRSQAQPTEKPKADDVNLNNSNQSPSYVTKEELEENLLKVNGKDDKDIEVLKSIAKGKGISLVEATKDELYLAFEDKRKRETKAAKAALGASNGSGSKAPQEFPATREDHKKLWEEKMGRG